MHLDLRHHTLGIRRPLKRHDLGEWLSTNHDTRGVSRGVSHHPLELLRQTDQLPVLGAIREGGKLGRLSCVLKADVENSRDRFRNAIDLAVALSQHATNVTNGGARRHRAEGDDLGHPVFPIFLGDVADHLITTAVLEIDVNIGHGDAVLIEEALKWEFVVKRIDWGNAERVGNDRTWCTASAGGGDPLLARKAHEVGHDEEVGRVPHLDDDVELIGEPRTCSTTRRAESAHKPSLSLLGEPGLNVLPRRHLNVGDARGAELQVEVHHLGDEPRVLEELRAVRKECRHLFWRLEVEVARAELHSPRGLKVACRADTEEHVMRVSLISAHVVQVVRQHEREAHFGCETEELLVEATLFR